LQKNPQATWQEVKDAIINCADNDNATGVNLPDNKWGYGKVNAYSAIKGCNVGIDENGYSNVELNVFPNPSNNKISIQYDLTIADYKVSTLEIRNVLGENVYSIPLNSVSNSIDVNDLKSGIYFCSVMLDKKEARVLKIVIF
jgi:hypothetical protein